MNSIRHYINLVEDLVKPEEKEIEIPAFDIPELDRRRSKSWRGGGYFSSAQEKDPHQVKVRNYMPGNIEHESKYEYLKSVKHLMGSNPFVPVVYNMKVIKDKSTGKGKTEITMEKLLKHDKVPLSGLYSTAIAFFHNMDNFNSGLADRLQTEYDEWYRKVTQDKTSSWHEIDLRNMIVKLLQENLESIYYNREKTNDENLNEVMDIIRDLIKNDDEFIYDLHSANFLFRRMPTGYQIVITDPISDFAF